MNHCHDDTNNPRQAKSLHGCNENLRLDTEEHERKQDNIELILTGRRVCNIDTFVCILCIIKLLNFKNNRDMLSLSNLIKVKFSQLKCL